MKKRVLVCGGREYGFIPRGVVKHTPAWIMAHQQASSEREILTKTLDALVDQIGLLIHGAARGADELAESWAQKNGVPTLSYRALWYPNGRSGGLDRSARPRHNQRMINEGRPDLVVAFPGGDGTKDMMSRAERAGVQVLQITDDPGTMPGSLCNGLESGPSPFGEVTHLY